jgi:FlaA1/EpsC-like NDP-sugar epimerase
MGIKNTTIKYPKQTKEKNRCPSVRIVNFCLDWVIFPTLLFVQFGATMYTESLSHALDVNWRLVHICIFLFCFVAGVYRQVIRRYSSDSLFLILLPEFFTIFLLCSVIFGSLENAFYSLVVSTGMLSVRGILCACQLLRMEEEPVQAEDYNLLLSSDSGEDGDEEECIL